MVSESAYAKPFVKWAGGKSQILNEIRMAYPSDLGYRINKYAEPFIGGGAVLFDVLGYYEIEEVYISDINRELIHTYISIRDNVDELIENLKDLEQGYLPLCDNERKAVYYHNRELYNSLTAANDTSCMLAALFIFLNRTCFNGLYRVNAKGSYNVPQGSYKNPCICDEENLIAVSKKLQNASIVFGDYQLSRDFIDDRTFAYFDPPYRPLSSTSSFTAYSQNGFDDRAQTELAQFIDEMSERGAYVLATLTDRNHHDEASIKIDKLYEKHKVSDTCVNRVVNSKKGWQATSVKMIYSDGVHND